MAADHTPEQVYFGLAGLLNVSDKEEDALSLPRGEYDLPVVIQDRGLGDGNRLLYLPGTGPGAATDGNSGAQTPTPRGGMMGQGMMGGRGMMGDGMMSGGMGSMMTRMMGFFGDTICVNGQPDARLEVATHAYRLRVLNASNARTYKIAWQDGRPLAVIATDGGLLDAPLEKDFVMLTPGQRVELWADFSQDAIGTEHRLISRAFKGSMGMMGGGMGGGAQGALDELMGRMMGGAPLPDGAEFPILTVDVTRKAAGTLELPRHLSTVARLRAEDAVNHKRPRQFRVTMGHMRWGFNGRSMRMNEVASDEIVKLDTTEIWEFENNGMMAHAIHLHGLQFQVLGWSGGTSGSDVSTGRIQPGWQDTVLLMPNERVRLIMRFKDFAGTYAYQCHMLEHAASGLMRDYRVKPARALA
jgi:FtsP/CotA-like multicopper oxidase with cupredoxin domain